MQELRQERGISMKDAARALEMPYTTYVNYEKGTREPNSETLINIANFYNTSIVNDSDKSIPPASVSALTEYGIKCVPWSARDKHLKEWIA
jgi:transcriptional regulator with XRE-family HTH domain